MERKDALTLIEVAAVGVGAWFGYEGYRCLTLQDQACIDWLNKRNGLSQPSANSSENTLTGDISPEPQSISESLPINSILVDPETGTNFNVVYVNGIRCIRLDAFSNVNWQDVWRAAKNLGPSQSEYQDHFQFHVYEPDLTLRGSFTTDTPPDKLDQFDLVPVNELICEDDIDRLD